MAIDEDLYRRCLEAVAPMENARMRKKSSAYVNTTEDDDEIDSARGRQNQIIDAVKQLKIATCYDISLLTKINHRSVQSAIGDLCRKNQLVRIDGPRYEIRKYRLPSVKKYKTNNA